MYGNQAWTRVKLGKIGPEVGLLWQPKIALYRNMDIAFENYNWLNLNQSFINSANYHD